MTTHLFCGPTISAAEARAVLPEAVIHPPVRHGDLLRLNAGPGDVVLIIDGVFHQSASVRHKEILALLADGATVAGCSSMGALRAAELDVYGMVGIGEVYRMYKDGVTDADADVAVTHTEGGKIAQLSMAMVDLDSQLLDARHAGVIDEADRARLAVAMRDVHYTERTPRRLALLEAPGIDAFRTWLDAHRDAGAKRRDALAALHLVARGEIGSSAPGAWAAGEWRTEYLNGWTDRHTGVVHEGHTVSRLACSQYEQVFDTGYPERWTRRVLAWIAGIDLPESSTTAALAESAVLAAAETGLHSEDLTAEQRRQWLTAAEDTALAAQERLIRILVRSIGFGAAAPGPGGDPDEGTVKAVARAYAVNDRAAMHGVTVDGLDAGAVREFLRRLWDLGDTSEEACTAAARDRGFRSFDGAVGVCRQFVLAEMGEGLWRSLGIPAD